MSENTTTLTTPLANGGRGAHVCLTPALLPLFNVEDYIVVVIDIFRATSSICYGIENGAEAIIPVSQVEECAAYREKGLDYLLAAERDGSVVEGFDFGNYDDGGIWFFASQNVISIEPRGQSKGGEREIFYAL